MIWNTGTPTNDLPVLMYWSDRIGIGCWRDLTWWIGDKVTSPPECWTEFNPPPLKLLKPLREFARAIAMVEGWEDFVGPVHSPFIRKLLECPVCGSEAFTHWCPR